MKKIMFLIIGILLSINFINFSYASTFEEKVDKSLYKLYKNLDSSTKDLNVKISTLEKLINKIELIKEKKWDKISSKNKLLINLIEKNLKDKIMNYEKQLSNYDTVSNTNTNNKLNHNPDLTIVTKTENKTDSSLGSIEKNNSTFSSGSNVTKGEYIILFMDKLGIPPNKTCKGVFKDINSSSKNNLCGYIEKYNETFEDFLAPEGVSIKPDELIYEKSAIKICSFGFLSSTDEWNEKYGITDTFGGKNQNYVNKPITYDFAISFLTNDCKPYYEGEYKTYIKNIEDSKKSSPEDLSNFFGN